MIDNIFTALTREKTTGAILEFVLWCVVCFTALLSLIALAMGGGQVTWILLMLFSVGLAVIMAFRLKPIALLYSVGVFYVITFLVHYLSFGYGGVDGISHSPLNIILFVLTLMLSLAVLICAFIHFFSRMNLGSVLTILVLCEAGAMLVLQILTYTSEYIGDASYVNEYHKEWMNGKSYWIGTVSFWLINAVTAVFYVCFFWGPIDSRKGKIIGNRAVPAGGIPAGGFPAGGRVNAGLQGTFGAYAGRTIYLQGQTLTIGSGEMVQVMIPDARVSRVHCAIRFNMMSGFYEILDQSSNGVWLSNGARLQKNVYNSVQRGSILYIGSEAQQFRLL